MNTQHFSIDLSPKAPLRAYSPGDEDFGITLTLTAGPGLVDRITSSAAERAATKALVIEGLSGGKGLYANTVEVG